MIPKLMKHDFCTEAAGSGQGRQYDFNSPENLEAQ